MQIFFSSFVILRLYFSVYGFGVFIFFVYVREFRVLLLFVFVIIIFAVFVGLMYSRELHVITATEKSFIPPPKGNTV